MPPRITHTTTSTQPDSGDGKISSNAWNEDHTIEGLGTAAASDVEDFAAASDLAGKLNASAVSAFGLTLLDDADAATARGTLGLGSAATQNLTKLTEHTTFFVSVSSGDDASDGSPEATPDDGTDAVPTGTPWATMQRASDVLSTYDFNGYDATILTLDGEMLGADFGGLKSSRANLTGLGWTNYGTGTYSALIIRGNRDDPAAVKFHESDGTIFKFGSNSNVCYVIDDFTLDYTSPSTNSAVCALGNGVTLFIGDGDGGSVRALGPNPSQGDIFNTTWNKATIWQYDTLYIDGQFDYAFLLYNGSVLITQGELAFGPTAGWGSAPGAFVSANENAYAEFWHSTTGSATGQRFIANGAVVDATHIVGSDLNTLPGSLPGIVSNGGAYYAATARVCDILASAVSGLATVAISGSAADLSGTLAAARLPAFAGGDITSSAGSAALAIGAGAVTLAKQANVATGTVFYRKTAGSGAPEVQTLATLKTDLGLTGTNSGDQDLSGYATTTALTTGLAGKQAAGSYLTANQTITLSGDASGSGATAITVTIGANKVTRGMLAATAGATLLGATAAGNVSDLTAAQAKTLLAITSADVTPPGSTTQVLFNDGGVLAGNAGLTFDKTKNALYAGGTPATGVPVLSFVGATQVGFRRNSTTGMVFTASGADIWFTGASNLSMRSNGLYGWSSTTDPTAVQDVVLSRVAAGVMKLANGSGNAGVIVTAATTVASLPAAATAGAGARGFVTDATASTFATTVAGGGSTKVPVYSDGTNWLIG